MKYIIYCDLDGVLVDFDKGYETLTGLHTKHKDIQDNESFWELFRNKLASKNITEKQYWENLDWMPDGKELYDYILKYFPNILTAPSRNPTLSKKDQYKFSFNESMQGKTLWIKRLFNYNKIYFKVSSQKQQLAKPNRILIDDREDNIKRWKDKGGIGIHHINSENTIKQLKLLGL